MSESVLCRSCGAENRTGAKFCNECGARLAAPRAAADERKTVTTLFCDLVSFTAMSEAADPEDVDALLAEYSSRARRAIESNGGTVEKFIGDAVVGVFGVPAAHEDDPERAVRAALRLLDSLRGLTRPDGAPLEARCGVNTGEALVHAGVDPASGRRFLAGDAVNTAARLQAAAPPGGVAVGALTYDLTQRAIVYEELPPVAAKGKAEPVTAWRATGALARRGIDVFAGELTPLVGRGQELARMTELFKAAVAESKPGFVLLVGEPGVGKSRLVWEFHRVLDDKPEPFTWRQGSCPSFGEETTYRALAEIVRDHAGISDGDDTATVEACLASLLPAGEDRTWMAQRLRALLGLEAPPAAREENFAAWRRFLEEAAAARPTVLVFEDLHWADEALLAFLEYLSQHISMVPLLFVGTARAELFERWPGFAAAGVERIALQPLTTAETGHLAAGLLPDATGRAALVTRVVERCGGNPFFVEQSVRLLADVAAGTVPESVQAVIAARLDALSYAERAVLCDAAVVGETFWDGALAALGDCDLEDAGEHLKRLAERRLVRRVRSSSFAGRREYRFVHALARDVAYERLPRGLRAARHASAAAWLEAEAGVRRGDLVETIAYHTVTALELARAAGRDELADSLAARAVACLTRVGDRAMRLDVATAAREYERAIDLLPDGDVLRRPALLQRHGDALYELGDLRLAADRLGAAATGFKEAGDVRSSAVAAAREALVLLRLGDNTASALTLRAVADLEVGGPSAELVFALERLANLSLASGDVRTVIDAAERAIAAAETLTIAEPLEALCYRGMARCSFGDVGGLDDVRRALAAAKDAGWARLVTNSYFNLGEALWLLRGAEAALEARRRALDYSERHGQTGFAWVARVALAADLFWGGRWDEALRLSLDADPALEAQGNLFWLVALRCDRALLFALRGDGEAADATAARRTDVPGESVHHMMMADVAFARAVAREALGDHVGARVSLEDHERRRTEYMESDHALRLAHAVRLAIRLDNLALAERLAVSVKPSPPLFGHARASAEAVLAEARGEHEAAAAGFADAAARWHEFGVPYEEGHALLGQGRCLMALGRAPEAAAPLAAAREIFARLGARPALAETESLLGRLAS